MDPQQDAVLRKVTGPITELRLRLRRTGYAPLPLIGKVPDFPGWQTKPT
jgi:hypothetical protein